MFKKILILFMILIIILPCVQTMAELSKPNTSATSVLLTESSRGQILLEKNINARIHTSIASKIMTAIIAIESLPEDTMVTVSKEAALTPGATLDLIAGERYLADNLIYALLLTDTNDSAIALAQSIAGNIDDFVDIMNSYAATLDMNDTVFKNPDGSWDDEQFTTARDLSNLIRYALNNEEFNIIFGTQIKPLYDDQKTHILMNQNTLFKTYRGIDGGKNSTNYSNNNSSITTATRDGLRLISIVLDSPKENILDDTILTFDYGFTNYQKGLLVKKGQILKTISIEDTEVNLIPKKDVYYTFLDNSNYIDNIEEIYNDETIALPITTNNVLMTMRYSLIDGTVINVDLYPDREITKPLSNMDIIKKQLNENIEILYLIVALIGVEIIWLFIKLLKILFSKNTNQLN